MSSPLVRFPDKEILLPLRYFGSVDYYAVMAAYGKARLSPNQRYDKRDKRVHRMDIHDVHGELSLTVPVCKPTVAKDCTWSDIGISDHGSWWHVHRVALESAYGRTPFFEFYIDRFLPFFTHSEIRNFNSVADYDIAITGTICDILSIDSPALTAGSQYSGRPISEPMLPEMPYWQIRSNEFGFIPHLSILDLIFSLGPEATLYLRGLIDRISI